MDAHMKDEYEWVNEWDDLYWLVHNVLKESLTSDLGNNEPDTEMEECN